MVAYTIMIFLGFVYPKSVLLLIFFLANWACW
jgi:hypothetical protein